MTCISKHSYKPGDIVLDKCQPFIKILTQSSRGTRCDYCFKMNSALKKCIGCKELSYCDKKCQSRDWKNGHKFECSLTSFPSICNNPNWMVMRLLTRIYGQLQVNPGKAEEALPLPDGSVRCFNDLLDHSEAEKDEIMLILVLTKLKELIQVNGKADDLETELLLQLYSIHKTNGFSILNEEESGSIGHGIYVQTSVFNHACKPNVFFSTSGTEMRIRAIGPIEPGESICISYIASHLGRDERRKELMHRYHFECNCERCASNLDADIDFANLQAMIENLKTAAASFSTPLKMFKPMMADHEKIIKIFRRIYNEYDDRVTNQYTRMFQVIELIVQKVKKSDVEPFLKEMIDHVLVTYGVSHFEYTILIMKLPRYGFGYLLEDVNSK